MCRIILMWENIFISILLQSTQNESKIEFYFGVYVSDGFIQWLHVIQSFRNPVCKVCWCNVFRRICKQRNLKILILNPTDGCATTWNRIIFMKCNLFGFTGNFFFFSSLCNSMKISSAMQFIMVWKDYDETSKAFLGCQRIKINFTILRNMHRR